MNNLENEVKALIIEALNLEDMTPEDIETDAPLFGEGLGLDSIDALELGLAVKKRFGVSLSGETEEARTLPQRRLAGRLHPRKPHRGEVRNGEDLHQGRTV